MNRLYTFSGYFGTDAQRDLFEIGFVAMDFAESVGKFNAWVKAQRLTGRGGGYSGQVTAVERGETEVELINPAGLGGPLP